MIEITTAPPEIVAMIVTETIAAGTGAETAAAPLVVVAALAEIGTEIEIAGIVGIEIEIETAADEEAAKIVTRLLNHHHLRHHLLLVLL